MDTESMKAGSEEQEIPPSIEKKTNNVEMPGKFINENAKSDENISTKVPVEDAKDSKADSISDGKKYCEKSSQESKVNEMSTSSERINTKRTKSNGEMNGDSDYSMVKSEDISDENLRKRLKLDENQLDSEIAECSGSKNDFSFRKSTPRLKKRYYRNKKNTEEEDESVETSAAQKSEADEEDESTSDSDDDVNFPLNPDDAEERRQTVRERRCNLPEFNRSPRLDERGSDDSYEWTTASEEESDIAAPVLKKEEPKPKWFIIEELVKRQMGKNPQFAGRFYGSLRAVQRLELKSRLNDHQGRANALNFNQRGNLLASTSDDVIVNIWDWAVEKKQFSFQTGHEGNVFEVQWLPFDTESLMVTSARDGQVRLFEVPVGKSRIIASHQEPIYKLAVHKETPHVILSCGGGDGKILSIDIREPRPYELLLLRDEMKGVQLYTIQSNPLNSNEFCVGGQSQIVRVYDRRKLLIPLHKLCPSHLTENRHAHVTSAVYNYNGTEILASYTDEDIYLFDTLFPHPSGDFAHRYQGHRNCSIVKDVNFFGPKSEHVLSGSDCGNIFLWDKDTEAIVQWMPGDRQGVVNCLEPHPFIPVLASGGMDYDVKIWVPSREAAPSTKGLEICVKANLKNRAEVLNYESDASDGLLWFLQRSVRQFQLMKSNQRVFMRMTNADRDLSDE